MMTSNARTILSIGRSHRFERWFIIPMLLVLGCESRPAAPTTEGQAQQAASNASPREFTIEEGFSPIAFGDMAIFPADATTAETWSSQGDELLCTGKPKCYLHTKTPYGDGTLRFDYQFEPAPKITDPAKLAAHNTGVLLFIQEPHAVWPKSIEVQGKHSEMGQLRPNGGAVAVEFQDSPDVRESARKPVGEWNSVEITIKAGAITASINGQVVAIGQPGELTSGLIGLQAEGHRLRYRHLRFAPAK